MLGEEVVGERRGSHTLEESSQRKIWRIKAIEPILLHQHASRSKAWYVFVQILEVWNRYTVKTVLFSFDVTSVKVKWF
jgi:hypothetical protein